MLFSLEHYTSIVNKLNVLYVTISFDRNRLQIQTIGKFFELIDFLFFLTSVICFKWIRFV